MLHFQINPLVDPAAIILTDDFSPVERLTALLVNYYMNEYSKWFYGTLGT